MGRLLILDSTGHTTVEWEQADEQSVEEVKARFESLMKHNFAYAPVADKPGSFAQITSFDPEVDEIIIRGPLVGG